MGGLERLRVSRDEEGNLTPKEGETLTLQLKIKVLPLTYGQSQRIDSFGLPIKRWTQKDKATLLRENLVELEGEPVGDDIEDSDLNHYEAYALMDILEGILYLSAINRLYEDPESGNVEDPVEEGEEAGTNEA